MAVFLAKPEEAESGAACTAAIAAVPAHPSLLEQFQCVVEQTHPSESAQTTHEVATCGCDCWYCTNCCMTKGMNLRARLIPVLETFHSIMMLTLTVDPALFESPLDTYFHIRKKRAIGELVRTLYDSGYLESRRYFCVIEFQKDTEQPHYHVLIETQFLPKDIVDKRWSTFRPKTAGDPSPNRPAFGITRFSKPEFEGGAVHAARYVTKYLTKAPEHGWPEWVLALGAPKRAPRYHISNGFWNEPPRERPKTAGKQRQPSNQTYAERTAECGTAINLFKIIESVDALTGDPRTERQWLARALCDREHLTPHSISKNPNRPRVQLAAKGPSEALRTLAAMCGQPISVVATSGAVPTGVVQ